jgi:hypothetical protein
MWYNFSPVTTRCLCFCFFSMKSPVVLSLLTKLWIVCLLGTLSLEIYVEIFADTLWQIRISRRRHTQIHVALKYTAPWRTTLCTNCNCEQMAYGADNTCLLLTNHKQIPKHLPHCTPWNIVPSSGAQIYYLPSFQSLSAIRCTDFSAKFLCASQPVVYRSPWIGHQRCEPPSTLSYERIKAYLQTHTLTRRRSLYWRKNSEKFQTLFTHRAKSTESRLGFDTSYSKGYRPA